MIKILVISTVEFGYGNGITNVIMNYYNAIDETIHMDFVVKQCIDESLKHELYKNGSKLYELNYRLKSPYKYTKRVMEIVKSGQYDIVHAHGNSHTLALEMYAAKKGGAKIRIPHSHNTTTKYPITHKILNRCFRKNYTHGFACGIDAGKWLFGEKPFMVINNGIDLNKFTYNEQIRQTYRSKYSINDYKVIGCVATFNSQKNHTFLIDIFSELHKKDASYKLLLVGNGSLKVEIESKVSRLGLTDAVIFMGKSTEVPQLMQAMDMLIMPSLFEGLPLTLIEAQATCLPCYVSDVVSDEVKITELINFISLDDSPKQWATIINNGYSFDREENRSRIIKQVKDSGYSIEDNALKVQSLYKQYYEQGE